MKAKYDIYIRKDLQESLDKESNMSGLINELLSEHFKSVYKQSEPDAYILSPKLAKENPDLVKDFDKSAERLQSRLNDFCNNGHSIPEGRSKCMGKGCKYS